MKGSGGLGKVNQVLWKLVCKVLGEGDSEGNAGHEEDKAGDNDKDDDLAWHPEEMTRGQVRQGVSQVQKGQEPHYYGEAVLHKHLEHLKSKG